MKPLFESVYDLTEGIEVLRRRYHGVIEVRDGELSSIRLRPWPMLVSQFRVRSDSRSRGNRPVGQDVCRLYYDQLWRLPNFLVLKYVVSASGTSFRSARRAALVLDEIARIKGSDAIVCEAGNEAISDRLLHRWGWQRHLLSSSRRHFIKRFYSDDAGAVSADPTCSIFPALSTNRTSANVSASSLL